MDRTDRLRVFIMFFLAVFLATGLTAADQTPALTDLAGLKKSLGEVPTLKEDQGKLLWGEGSDRFALREGKAKDLFLLDTGLGPISTRHEVLAQGTVAAKELAKLVDLGVKSGMKADEIQGFEFGSSVLLGWRLQADQAVVCSYGVLRRETTDITAQSTNALKQAVTAAQTALAKTQLSDLAKAAAKRVLDEIIGKRELISEDRMTPEVARRLVRHGWLEQLGLEPQAIQALKKALDAAETLQIGVRFKGVNALIERRDDPLGKAGRDSSYVLQSPDFVRTILSFPAPSWHGPLQDASRLEILKVVVDLPAKTKLNTGAFWGDQIQAAQVMAGSQVIAKWNVKDGFQADEDLWRRMIPGRSKGDGKTSVVDLMPPHIPVADALGDMQALIVPKGVLLPPKDGTPAQAEVFLANASKLLPGAGLLDLVGQYLFKYVYDSPDPAFPLAIGDQRDKGDIHQTAVQTIGTVTGGIMRGDCDDVAELFQNLSQRQGKISIVVSLPSHAACAWAEKSQSLWHVIVMQTGPTKEFTDAELPKALQKAYESFGLQQGFDPNGLGLLLRFSGENTRSSWRLSWRIFADKQYCEDMIEVQKAWHFQTYQRGIDTMLAMIGRGDEDTANYRELSGLYNFTGQYAKAVEYHTKAIERTKEPVSRLQAKGELVGHLLRASRNDEAKKTTEEILNVDLPPLRQQMGAGIIPFSQEIATELLGFGQAALAAKVLSHTSAPLIEQTVGKLTAFAANAKGPQDERWRAADQALMMSKIFCLTSIAVLSEDPNLLSTPEGKTLAKVVDHWLAGVAFARLEDAGDVTAAYASVGQVLAMVLGQDWLDGALTKASMPTDRNYQHHLRAGGLCQIRQDIPWIKASSAWWSLRIAKLTERRIDKLDSAAFKIAADGLAAAMKVTKELDLEDAQGDRQAEEMAFVVALIRKDEAKVRATMKEVKRLNDKRMRDDIAQQIGDQARFMDDAWFDKVVGMWKTEIDYKDKWLWIAWRAALGKAPEKAQRVADLAAERYKDDPAFVAEAKAMRASMKKP